MYYINNVLKNMKKTMSKMMFHSDISSTKFTLGLTSLLWVLIDCFDNYQTNLFFKLMMFSYGSWLIWRIFDSTHRKISSTIMSSLGVALWSNELWSTVLYDNFESHPALHYAARIVLLLTSIWVLIRMGTGTLPNRIHR